MSDKKGSEARLAEYRQELVVNRLREVVHHGNRPPEPARLSELLDAEARLKELRDARVADERGAEAGGFESMGAAAAPPRGLLASFARKPSEAPDVLGVETTGIDVQVRLRMAQVPTSVVHLFDPSTEPLVSITIKYAGSTFGHLRVTTHVEGYSARAVDTVELGSGESKTVDQLPTFFPSALAAVLERTRATLHIQIDDLERDRVEFQQSYPIWLLPRTTAYLSVLDPMTDEARDLRPYLGAYVTPNAEPVMQVLREAAGKHPDRSIVGYQGPKAKMASTVRAQVAAVYAALRARQISYVNSVFCFGATGTEAMQRVRLPRESLATRSANCIDGTVLMASVLEAASLEAAIVLVPGHAFLGFDTSPGDARWEYVETTMLRSHVFAAAHKRGCAEAKAYERAAKQDQKVFRLLPISMLRTGLNILPME